MRANMMYFVGALVAASGCSHGDGKSTTEEVRAQTPHAEADTQGGMTSMTEDIACPMQVAGTTVHAEETTSGPALAFATTGDVNELRSRVQRMAAEHNRAVARSSNAPSHVDNPAANDMTKDGMMNTSPETANSPSLQGGSIGTQGVMPQGKGAAPMGKAREEDIESGARLVFAVEDASQLDQLRERVHANAQRLAAGKCPMAPMTESGQSTGVGTGYPND